MPPSDEQPDLLNVDWSRIPAPVDDGRASHLAGASVPDVALQATDGRDVSLARIGGRVVVFAYPRTGRPGEPALVADWDAIPGARGCTPQSCAFRDLHAALRAAGAAHVFGLSTQSTADQREAATRLHLPFALLSDEALALQRALALPTLEVAGRTLLARLALVIDDEAIEPHRHSAVLPAGRRSRPTIAHVLYPVFPPDRNAADVLAWLERHPR
jgi:peroxiredoxin